MFCKFNNVEHSWTIGVSPSSKPCSTLLNISQYMYLKWFGAVAIRLLLLFNLLKFSMYNLSYMQLFKASLCRYLSVANNNSSEWRAYVKVFSRIFFNRLPFLNFIDSIPILRIIAQQNIDLILFYCFFLFLTFFPSANMSVSQNIYRPTDLFLKEWVGSRQTNIFSKSGLSSIIYCLQSCALLN